MKKIKQKEKHVLFKMNPQLTCIIDLPMFIINLYGLVPFSDTEVYEATALYDFRGRTERELSFKKGDNLLLYTKASAEWWEGAFAGKEGLVPSNYVAIKHQ